MVCYYDISCNDVTIGIGVHLNSDAAIGPDGGGNVVRAIREANQAWSHAKKVVGKPYFSFLFLLFLEK